MGIGIEEVGVDDVESRGSTPHFGARTTEKGTEFRVWSSRACSISVEVERPAGAPLSVSLNRGEGGVFEGFLPEVGDGDRYRYRIDGGEAYPDPASRYQPEGVHGPSEVVDPGKFAWTDDRWRGIPAADLVIYELHVGTFSPDGTFDGVTARLPMLRDLGVTAIELMPIADFAGNRSWGYDGVALFAPARCYGRPDDLRRLVDQAHALGIAVFLDVVYNHFGPVGNYAIAFSPEYLSDHNSEWAACINLDGPGSDMVNAFFVDNALHWIHEYHLDGLRLDATHALHDGRTVHFLETLTATVHAAIPGRRISVIAEDHRNLDTMIRPRWAGGWDLDGVWADDFHHQVRRNLAGDNEGYYRDYTGTVRDIVKTLNQGWFFTGQNSIHLAGPRGTDPVGIPPRRFVIAIQNHDQVGNRPFGDRLHHGIDAASYRAAVALLLCAPQTPLLFMGQEWGASTPFLYFTDHDEDLGKVVTEGRRREFRHFLAFVDPVAREQIPDPQAVATFENSRLDWSEREQSSHAAIWRLHGALLTLRRTDPALRADQVDLSWAVAIGDDALLLDRKAPSGERVRVVVKLRGSGIVDLGTQNEIRSPSGFCWECVFSTEEPEFAVDSMPIRIEGSATSPVITFHRPGAVILRAVPDNQNGPKHARNGIC